MLAATDADARAASLSRSEMIEQALRNKHLRVALQNYTTPNCPGARDRRLHAEGVWCLDGLREARFGGGRNDDDVVVCFVLFG